ncbi:MAG TPA: TRZ/ATZ family hydrolase [Steroidobacteraceae bacterium]|nr:TRZ/ATZ family hydrolase [Steroidobacteraceae bacterium]
MQKVDLAIRARWVIPVEPPGLALEDHAIVVNQGRIVACLPSDTLPWQFEPAQVIDRPEHVVLPGLVNAHTHAAATLLRGVADDLPLDRWLRDAIWPLEKRWVDPEFVRDGSELAIAAMLASGTTCFADMYLFPEMTAAAASRMHIRACIGLPVVDAPTAWAGSSDEYIAKGLALHDEYRDDPLVTTAFAPHAPYTVSDATLIRVRRAADELDMPVTMHLHESEREIADSLERHGVRPLARLERLGLANPLLCGIHMTRLDETDLELIERRSVQVVHCPQSNLKLGNGIAPVPGLLERGINVAIGTDGPASNNDLDMIEELRLATLLARSTGADQKVLDAHRALRLATLNGAQALGLAESIGSIQPGKWADLLCVDLGGVQTQPVHEPASALVFAASRSEVSDVWVAGRAVVADHRLLRGDLADILERASAWAARIRETDRR